MLVYLGLQSLPTEMLYFVTFMAFAASAVFGWTTDMAMKDHGFGPVGNALLGIVGAVFGPRIWFVGLGQGPSWEATDPTSMLVCAAAAGALLLFAAAVLKKALASA
jgi:uncharacterized membrane protein YeaQ/YmgE (transglycosylase-associated protein family)